MQYRFSALVLAVTMGFLTSPALAQDLDLEGAWNTEAYILKDGSEYPVEGLIFFTEKDWTVLFFVVDEEEKPRRGAGEGGSYSLDGSDLVLKHHYHLSVGEKMGALSESPLRMEAKTASEIATEPCRVEGEGNHLTIFFPSGNRMTFTRSSR